MPLPRSIRSSRNLNFVEGDTILYFSSTYGTCEKTIQSICETTPAKSRRIDVIFSSNDSATEQLLRHTIEDVQSQGGNARIAMFDTVATFPEVRLPLERLAKACQDLGVSSMVRTVLDILTCHILPVYNLISSRVITTSESVPVTEFGEIP